MNINCHIPFVVAVHEDTAEPVHTANYADHSAVESADSLAVAGYFATAIGYSAAAAVELPLAAVELLPAAAVNDTPSVHSSAAPGDTPPTTYHSGAWTHSAGSSAPDARSAPHYSHSDSQSTGPVAAGAAVPVAEPQPVVVVSDPTQPY